MFILQAGGMDPGLINMLFIGAMMLVFYFFMIRPQAKRQREQQEFETDLSEGAKIVTSSGIIGRVSKVEKNAIVLEIGAGTKTSIRIIKSAISKEMTDALNSPNE